jgi:hypothetical protein
MKKITTIIILTLAVLGARAQKTSFTISAPGAVEVGETFNVTYSVNKNGSDFSGPTFTDFEYRGGPFTSQSQSTQIINGSMTSTFNLSFTYQLRAIKPGKFTLPAATIKVGGKTIKSGTKVIEVVKGTAQAPQSQAPQSNPAAGNEPAPEGLIFARTLVSKKTAYIGEPILVTQKIYSQKRIANITDFKQPSYDGFWKEDIDIGQLKLSREAYGNKTYYTVTMNKMLLFPQKAGKLELGSFNTKAVISIVRTRKARDQWEQWMYGNTVRTSENTNVEINSPKVYITVKPLPEKGKPAGFTGVVGSFTMRATTDRNTVNANDAINLKIKVSGTGNIDLLDVPKPVFPPDFEVYDPKINSKSENTIAGVKGSKSYEYLIIPRNEGEYVIPPVKFSYFDSGKGKYITLTSDTFRIKVGKGKGGVYTAGSTVANREDIKYLGKDIRFIKTKVKRWQPAGYHFFNSTTHLMIIGLLPLLLIAALVITKKIRKDRADVVTMRNRKATKVARKRLHNAGKLLKANDRNGFYIEISKVLWGYLSDKFNIPMAELSMDNVREKLSDMMDGETIDEIIKVLDHCEFARFSPGTESTEMQDIYDETMEIISKIEKKLK